MTGDRERGHLGGIQQEFPTGQGDMVKGEWPEASLPMFSQEGDLQVRRSYRLWV